MWQSEEGLRPSDLIMGASPQSPSGGGPPRPPLRASDEWRVFDRRRGIGARLDLLGPTDDLAELQQGQGSLRARFAASPLTLLHLRGEISGYEEKVPL